MGYKSTYELLQPVIAAIDKTFTILSIVDNGSFNYTLNACNTLWATQGFSVTIGGNSYVIQSIVPNVSITVQGSVVLTAMSLYAPVFYHGTIKATSTDLERPVNGTLLSTDKLPMIWLHEPTDETYEENPKKAIAFRAKVELYFMIDGDMAVTNDDAYTYFIKPMRNLIDSFMSAVKSAKTINENLITTSAPKDFARWGVYMGKDGGEKTIFNRPMSGTKFEVEIPFIKSSAICC